MAEDQKEQLEDIEGGDSKSTEEQVEDALNNKRYEEAKALLAQEDFSDEGLRKIRIGVDKEIDPNGAVETGYDVIDAEGRLVKSIKSGVANHERENSDLCVSVEQMVAASHSLKDVLIAIKEAKTNVFNLNKPGWKEFFKSLIPFRGIKNVVEKKDFKRNMAKIGNITKHMSQEGQDIFNSLPGDNITPSRGETAEIAGDIGLTAGLLSGFPLIATIPTIGAYITSFIQKVKSLDDPVQIMAMFDELEEYIQKRYDKLNEIFSGMNSALIDAGVKNLEQLAARAA